MPSPSLSAAPLHPSTDAMIARFCARAAGRAAMKYPLHKMTPRQQEAALDREALHGLVHGFDDGSGLAGVGDELAEIETGLAALGKFKIKKLAKKVKKTVKKAVPAPVRKLAAPVVKPLSKVVKPIAKPLLKAASPALRFVPGGNVPSVLLDTVKVTAKKKKKKASWLPGLVNAAGAATAVYVASKTAQPVPMASPEAQQMVANEVQQRAAAAPASFSPGGGGGFDIDGGPAAGAGVSSGASSIADGGAAVAKYLPWALGGVGLLLLAKTMSAPSRR